MTVDYAKQTIQRQEANQAARPKATESREDRLVTQLNMLADHAALLHKAMRDAQSVVSCSNVFEWIKYLEGVSDGLLQLEATPAEGLQRKYDYDRDSILYRRMRSAISFKMQQQYQQDKFQP